MATRGHCRAQSSKGVCRASNWACHTVCEAAALSFSHNSLRHIPRQKNICSADRTVARLQIQHFRILRISVGMMCDTTSRNFRMQLAAVLENLTKAALIEIGNLADECSSVLLTEISLHKTENEALKKRCYSLEVQLKAAREAQTYPAHVNCGGRRQPAGERPLNSMSVFITVVLPKGGYPIVLRPKLMGWNFSTFDWHSPCYI